MADFKTLWKMYPSSSSIKKRCVNKQESSQSPFGNYCAISLSECLIQSGIALQGARGTKCWSHTGPKHLLRAEDFAKWLKSSRPPKFGKAERIASGDFQSTLDGRTGIVFFKDYWRRGGQSEANRSGDHIDLWNEDGITSSSMWWRAVIEFFDFVSDLNASKEIWFWEVK